MGRITILGHGYEKGQLTLEAVDLLRSGAKIILHTEKCGCAEWLRGENIAFDTLDSLYESCEDFDEHAEAAADAVRDAAEQGDVIYGVFDVRDRSVAAILDGGEDNVRVVAGPPVEGALLARTQGAVQLLEASDWENYALSSARSALVREMDSWELASEVKLKLMEVYPEESIVFVRLKDKIVRTELYNLDRLEGYDHRTCVLAPAEQDLMKLERFDFERFVEIISILCGPNGCDWDREQTHESLRSFIVEEAYEAVDAINEEDTDHLYDELGDMLLQIVLHADIGRRYGEFNISDVITAISEKMISRHTHVFGNDVVENTAQISELWAKNKMAERGQTTYAQSMRGVTRSLPSMLRATKVLKRLDDACGQRENASEAAERAAEAIGRAVCAKDAETALGDALLKVAALTRTLKIDPELALNAATDRLIGRFEAIENSVMSEGKNIGELCDEKSAKVWHSVKLSDFEAMQQE